tara:strand:+ start:826 stop:1605 length:780 start_codon:yes stop_codon:yes gene_type:complete
MGRKKEIGNILSEELQRFNQIGEYVTNLHEQFVGGGGSGFENNQGASSLLNKFQKRQEIGEQDDLNIELDPIDTEEEDTEETSQETPTDAGEETDDLGLDDDDLGLGDDLSVEDTETTDSGGSTEEIDVTDIVSMTKETGEKTEELEGTIDKQKDSIDSLISKLDDLEGKLNSMDKVMSSINNLEDKIEEYRPQTPEEKLELRYLDSGPFNQSPKKYWEEKKGDLKQQKDKHEYVLTSDEVEDVNDNDIKNSWVYSPED